MKSIPPFFSAVFLMWLVTGCTRPAPAVGELEFNIPMIGKGEDRDSAFYWSEVFQSVSFHHFIETKFPEDQRSLVRRAHLRPINYSYASVSLDAGTADEETMATTVVADALNAFYVDRDALNRKQHAKFLQDRIATAPDPATKRAFEAMLKRAEQDARASSTDPVYQVVRVKN